VHITIALSRRYNGIFCRYSNGLVRYCYVTSSQFGIHPFKVFRAMADFKVPTQLLLSLSTAPLLLLLVSGKALAKAMNELGQASEEIFRGDRLPILHISKTVDQED
jgi:hypothetical protein